MIYIETNDKNEVVYTNNLPFDPVFGLGKTEEELLINGHLIDSIPSAENVKGKSSIRIYDPVSNSVRYVYEDVVDEESKLVELEKQIAAQQLAINTILGV